MLKILLVGLGSIGSRHLSCLNRLGEFDLAALRTFKGTKKENLNLKEFFNLNEALSFKPDGVIISNPTSHHIETALPFLKRGIKVLIEKPVSHSTIEAKKTHAFSHLLRVAYCMRFHPLNQQIKNIVSKETPFKLGFHRSYYLPKWHPYADYRTEYVALKKLGGGVIRTLSHEIDLMVHWFGVPSSVTGVVDKVSNLEIDTDDYAFFSCGFKKGFRVNFELDLFSPLNINEGEMFTKKGKYHWNMSGIWFNKFNETEPISIINFENDSLNEMYLHQIADFINFINVGTSQNATLSESIQTLKIIEQLDS